VPKALANRFREISQKAERALAGGDEGAAIRAYEDGLLTLGDDYGRAHLRTPQCAPGLRTRNFPFTLAPYRASAPRIPTKPGWNQGRGANVCDQNVY
jgi:hypothetical protein